MADNVDFQTAALATPANATKVATEQVAGTLEQKQIVELGIPGTGRTLIPGDAANGLDVDVTRLPPLVAGAATIGKVDQGAAGLTRWLVDASGVAVPVTDNGGSLTVDPNTGTVWDVSDRAARLVGVVSGGANVFHVDDNAGSLTVDAPVGTPVFMRLSDGAAALVGQKAMAASLPVTLASDQSVLPAVAEQRASTLWVTGTAAVNTAVTLTLPAAGVGLFHYITSIQVDKLYSVVGVAAGAGVLITTTNLPGNPVWTTEQLASVAGTVAHVVSLTPATPIKSSVANTATTIVCPVQLQTIWRANVSYFTAA